jgi:hypothetical protein
MKTGEMMSEHVGTGRRILPCDNPYTRYKLAAMLLEPSLVSLSSNRLPKHGSLDGELRIQRGETCSGEDEGTRGAREWVTCTHWQELKRNRG